MSNILSDISGLSIDEQAENEAKAIKRASILRPKNHNRQPNISIKGLSLKPKRIITSLSRKRVKRMSHENETKEAKFNRLATSRVTKTLKSISNIGNLSTGAYCYTPEQVQQIETALYGEVEQTMAKFNKASIKTAKGFSFSTNG